MSLSSLTDPQAVRRALAEYDELGRDAFLSRYGYGPSTRYVLVVDGRRYEPKAIAGVAHGYQFPDQGPLGNDDFTGGDQTNDRLRALGFTVEQRESPPMPAAAALADFLTRYGAAKLDPFRGDHDAARLLKLAAEGINAALPPELAGAIVRASVGQGNWAAVPWIAVLDPRVTTTTQHGIYPVVLVREDLSGLYLTIAQGVTDLKKYHGVRGAYEHLRANADRLVPALRDLQESGFTDGAAVDLGSSSLGRDYAASTVIAKFYAREDLAGSPFGSDAETLLGTYASLLRAGALAADTPANEDAMKALSIFVGSGARANFESGGRRGWWGWKQQPAPDVLGVSVGDLVLFGSGYSGGSPRVDSEVWQTGELRELVVARIERPPFETTDRIMPDELSGQASYPWKIRFTILGTETNVALVPGQALSRDTSEALRVSAIAQGRGGVSGVEGSPLLEPYVAGGPGPTVAARPDDLRDLTSQWIAAVGQSGMATNDGQLAAFLASVLAKPFVVLTGQSGSGKTQLAKRLGEWCGKDADDRPRYTVIPVRPDWTGPEFLFGYADGLAERVEDRGVWAVPETLEFILRAHGDPAAPYVLILDEMNLAHVERYFADFLSGIESRDTILPPLERRGSQWLEVPRGLRHPLPPNLIVVGTVNVDETTYMFSPKVLDRAFVHEFRVTASELDPEHRRPTPVDAADTESLERVVRVMSDDGWHLEHPHPNQQTLVVELRKLHEQLALIGADFGHRVFYEALRFAALADAAGLQRESEVLDFIVMTKLLPKVHGSRQRLETALLALHVWAGSAEGDAPRYPRTYEKLERMLAVLRDAQFVTFTE